VIVAIEGANGSGKSVLANSRGLHHLSQGRTWFMNNTPNEQKLYEALRRKGVSMRNAEFYVTDKVKLLKTPDDLFNAEDGFITMDEAHQEMSRDYKHLISPKVTQKWSQHRKWGIDAYIVTQDMNSILPHVKKCVTEIWRAEEDTSIMCYYLLAAVNIPRFALGKSLFPRRFKYTLITSSNNRVRARGFLDKIGKTMYKWLDLDEAGVFDTLELIQSSTTDLIHEEMELARLKKIYKGETVPTETCPHCKGTGVSWKAYLYYRPTDSFMWQSIDINERYENGHRLAGSLKYPFNNRYNDEMLKKGKCETCMDTSGWSKGYVMPPNHPDMLKAQEMAKTYGWK